MASVVDKLKSIESQISHDKENKLNRELLLRGEEALEVLNLHYRSLDDHANFSARIEEKDVMKVYYSMTNDLKNQVCNIQKLCSLSTLTERKVFSNRKIPSHLKTLGGVSLVSAALIKKFSMHISVLFGSYAPFAVFAGIFALANKSANNKINDSFYVKSIIYNQLDSSVAIDFYSKTFKVERSIYNISDIKVENNASNIILNAGNLKFYVDVLNNDANLDLKLLNSIFNKERDLLVESVLVNNGKFLNFACPYTSNPNVALDLLLRDSYLKLKGKDDSPKYEEDFMSISDKNLQSFREKTLSQIQASESGDNLSFVEETLKNNGLEKAREATEFLNRTFLVENSRQLKSLGDYEIAQLAKNLGIHNLEVEALARKIRK